MSRAPSSCLFIRNQPWSWICATHGWRGIYFMYTCGVKFQQLNYFLQAVAFIHYSSNQWNVKAFFVRLSHILIIRKLLTAVIFSLQDRLCSSWSCINILHSSQSGSNLYFSAWSDANTGNCCDIVILPSGHCKDDSMSLKSKGSSFLIADLTQPYLHLFLFKHWWSWSNTAPM